ncbi:DUF2309 domain-containing protein [Flavobacterium ovatum]|uniref:YbcC family protein n=1 Tax=Flavobacterium ovatum TaxID=1928857 RepID=UPI00344CD6CC
MKHTKLGFEEQSVLHHLTHYLPAQAPLKDFVHHNTLHAFQDRKFFTALHESAEIFGYKTYMSLSEFRNKYSEKEISSSILHQVLFKKKSLNEQKIWLDKLLNKEYDLSSNPRIGKLRSHWKVEYKINLDKLVHSSLFRVLCSYLDQGIAIWSLPLHEDGFLASLRQLEKTSYVSLFKQKRAKELLLDETLTMEKLLHILVGDEKYFEEYLFDQQFAHPGWSGMIAAIENQPESLLDRRKISLKEVILFELLLEIDALDGEFGLNWAPISHLITQAPIKLFAEVKYDELYEVLSLWQQAFEWTLYDQVLLGVKATASTTKPIENPSFQALFCIDDRECSIRRHVEKQDAHAETFGTPGHFNVEFFYQPIDGKFYTKLCPAPVTPKFLIKEIGVSKKRETDIQYNKYSHSLIPGWIISQTLGFSSALRLFLNIFKPTMTPATSSSFRHLDKKSTLSIDFDAKNPSENDLQIGFKPEEMAQRVEGVLRSVGLIEGFSSLVYLVGHGATSANNTHYAGYDCGACCGRPGSVNAKVFAYMANDKKVRTILETRGITIPETTQFVGALHDTTRDDITFFDEELILESNLKTHQTNIQTLNIALDKNAKERSRRFESIDSNQSLEEVHEKVRRRSVSLFEPRPELNHATNALCVVGRRTLSRDLFLDRRSFMNSFDYSSDPNGDYLVGILNAVAPVCGGINLEYYFSRVDNQKLGAGTKLPHNVMGLLGVANGIDGDLRPGLPSQMIEVHDPVRLMVVVEHFPEIVFNAISKSPQTYEWFKNEWVRLVAVHPETKVLYVFENEKFDVYETIQDQIAKRYVENMFDDNFKENLPISILN